jgi:hypothetical protein
MLRAAFRKPRLTIQEKKMIIDQDKNNIPRRKIAREFNVAASTVTYICTKIKQQVIDYIEDGVKNPDLKKILPAASRTAYLRAVPHSTRRRDDQPTATHPFASR